MVRAGRRVMSKLHRLLNDDERQRDIDRLLEALELQALVGEDIHASAQAAFNAAL